MPVPERLHAELGASSADRWLNCTGSVAMVRDIPNLDTPYTREGTAAHSLAERCMTNHGKVRRRFLDPHHFVGTEIAGVEVTEEMAESVSEFLAVVKARRSPGASVWVEQRFSLDPLDPPAPMFGTSDVVIYDPRLHRLTVVDFKFGAGYAVAAVGNPQLRYYALGAVVMMPDLMVDEIDMIIVQPRAPHPDGTVREDRITPAELFDFAAELLAKAHEAMQPGAPLTAGPWCRFCRAQATCPQKLKSAQALAQVEFREVLDHPPAPETLTPEQLRAILEHAPLLEAWLKAVRQHIANEIASGRPFAGWKLVEKRAIRRWVDDEQARAWLMEMGVTPEEFERRDLRSVAQIEKIMGKGEIPEQLVEKKSSGVTLAPEYDQRPAVVPGSEFGALPAILDD